MTTVLVAFHAILILALCAAAATAAYRRWFVPWRGRRNMSRLYDHLLRSGEIVVGV